MRFVCVTILPGTLYCSMQCPKEPCFYPTRRGRCTMFFWLLGDDQRLSVHPLIATSSCGCMSRCRVISVLPVWYTLRFLASLTFGSHSERHTNVWPFRIPASKMVLYHPSLADQKPHERHSWLPRNCWVLALLQYCTSPYRCNTMICQGPILWEMLLSIGHKSELNAFQDTAGMNSCVTFRTLEPQTSLSIGWLIFKNSEAC